MYLLRSAVWLIGFGMTYFIFLRNERYFLLNRIFLFSGLLASALFPLLNWHYTIIVPIVTSSIEFQPGIQALSAVEPFFSVQRFIQILYLSGVFVSALPHYLANCCSAWVLSENQELFLSNQ